MVYAFLGHFVIGNVVLGVIEGALITAITRRRRPWWPIVAMVAANFASFFVGTAVLHGGYGGMEPVFGDVPIDAAIPTLIAVAVLAYIATVIVEWPAVWVSAWAAAPRLDANRITWMSALIACAAVNAATYAMLTVWYVGAMDLSLVTDTERVEPDALLDGAPAFDLCVIDDGGVTRWVWTGDGLRRVGVIRPLDDPRRRQLVAGPSDDASTEMRLLLVDRGVERDPVDLAGATGALPAMVAWDGEAGRAGPAGLGAEDAMTKWHVVWWDHRDLSEAAWFPRVRRMRDAVDIRSATGERLFSLGLDTIGGRSRIERPTALPGDLLIMGVDGQVVALHVPTKRLARLCAGRWPVVLLHEDAEPPTE